MTQVSFKGEKDTLDNFTVSAKCLWLIYINIFLKHSKIQPEKLKKCLVLLSSVLYTRISVPKIQEKEWTERLWVSEPLKPELTACFSHLPSCVTEKPAFSYLALSWLYNRGKLLTSLGKDRMKWFKSQHSALCPVLNICWIQGRCQGFCRAASTRGTIIPGATSDATTIHFCTLWYS